MRFVACLAGARLVLPSEDAELDFFVVETKGSSLVDDLRLSEAAKIHCGKAHFKALEVRERPARYEVATSVDELVARTVGE